jgi:uncharacterized protein (TIRG00374 family)
LIAIGEEKLIDDLKLKFLILILLIFSMLLLFKNYSAFITFIWKFKRVLPKNIRRKGREMELTEEKAKMLINTYMKHFSEWRFISKVSLPTLIVVLASPVILQLSTLVFSITMTYKTAFVIFWASAIVGRLSGLPGGFGSQDITMIGLFSIFGIDPAAALKITLVYRFVIMAPIIALGGPLFFHLGKRLVSKRY